jgi:hypothetical protein
MLLSLPKNTERLLWTEHAKAKMRFYGLTESRLKKVLRHPKRREAGVAPRTVAIMQPASVKVKNGQTRWSQEIWLMYQETRIQKSGPKKTVIISAWRYPGVSRSGGAIPIPDDIQRELNKMKKSSD